LINEISIKLDNLIAYEEDEILVMALKYIQSNVDKILSIAEPDQK
jgi:hypothetical protein